MDIKKEQEMELPKNEGGHFEIAPAGTFIARCYRFIDLGSHEQTFQGESKGLKRLVMIGFELPTELMTEGEYAGRPFSIHKRYTWSTHEKATMRKDLESWRGRKFNDNDFGPGGFDVRNLLGKTCTLTVTHSEGEKQYANIAAIGAPMKGIAIPEQINPSVYFSLEPNRFEGNIFDGLSEKLREFIRDTPEYRALTQRRDNYADQKGRQSFQAPLDPSRELETAGPREFAPLDDDLANSEIPF